MKKTMGNKYWEEMEFPPLLACLRRQDEAVWEKLIGHFRERALPYLKRKVGRFGTGSVLSADYFVEEVFANSLAKFYELFEEGQFENIGQLRGLFFRIVDNQLLAAYKTKKRNRLVFFSDDFENQITNTTDSVETEMEADSRLQTLRKAIGQLPDAERYILQHFSQGGKLRDAAAALDLSEANCRKKKQRAMQKLRAILQPLLVGLLILKIHLHHLVNF